MAEQTAASAVQRTTSRAWTPSWRPELVAKYELQQARLRVLIEDSAEPEEHL